ncbi:uncharacterized protein [Mytilus edulis]|uniref:uncharacterized protein n=1 Tax=Mytilus edulis TaxID=6550 RepID=UPI0039EF49EB
MLRIFKLILLTTIFLLSLSSEVQIKEIQESWFEAVKQCNTTASMILTLKDIYDVDKDTNPCKEDGIKTNTLYWIESYHKLSNIISVEGCYQADLLNTNLGGNGHKSLRHCYLECTKISNSTTTFAYKNSTAGGVNCLCNLNAIKELTEKSERNLSECTSFDRSLWWRYKILKNEFPTNNESCHMISCEDRISKDKFVKDILCGHYNGKTPDEDSRYVCTTSTDNNMPPSQLLPSRFSFISNASIKTDSDPNSHMIAECKSITCLRDNTFKITIKNCTSETLHFLCLNGSKTIPIYGSKKPENNSSHTTARELSTESTFEANTTNAPSVSIQSDGSTSVDTTLFGQITTKLVSKAAETNVTFSTKYISSVATRYVTNPGKGNMLQITSPIVLNQNVNDKSSMGLIIGLSVGTVSIIVAVVVLVSLWIRRNGPFKNKRDDSQIAEFHGQKDHNTDIASNKEPHIVNNSTYEMQAATENVNEIGILEQDSNNIPNSEYAVVIKKRKMIDKVNNQQHSHDEENLDVIENEYDGLNHNRPDSFTDRNNTTNIYDTALGVRDTSDSTYVTANHVHVVDKDKNCVYDHM